MYKRMKRNYNASFQLSGKVLFTAWAVTFISFASVGQMVDTNVLALWLTNKSLTWSAETNGFQVGVEVGPKSSAKEIDILVLSSKETGHFYVLPPSGKPPKLELRDTNQVVIQPIKNKMDGELPQRIPASNLAHSQDGIFPGRGPIYDWFLLGPNSPNMLKAFVIGDVYQIMKEADYTLTVFPVIYKFETNGEYADRIDLPSVTTKIHLAPLQGKK